jgi:hypothetical protein
MQCDDGGLCAIAASTGAGAALEIELVAMKKHNNKKSLSLNTETVRSLADADLGLAAGGVYYESQVCTRFNCVIKTPKCPI